MKDRDKVVISDIETRKERTLFLTILCALNFAWLGYCSLYYLYEIILRTIIISNVYFKDNPFFQDHPTFLSRFFDNLHLQSDLMWNQYGIVMPLIRIAAISVILLGTLLMWKLKKKGYFIFVIAQLTPIIIYIILRSFAPWGFWGWVYFAPSIIPIVFIIMFTFNYKHLK